MRGCARYRVYLSDVSYFSGKLEGALRAKHVGYERVRITPSVLLDEVLPNTGWMKVPAVRRDDGLWLCDTTPMLRWFDAEHPERRLVPADPYRAFLSALIEDYCDEWQWRPAMFWRWAWADNARYLGSLLGEELSHGAPHPAWLMAIYFRRRQQRIYLRGDGVTRDNFDTIAGLYPRALGWLDALLRDRLRTGRSAASTESGAAIVLLFSRGPRGTRHDDAAAARVRCARVAGTSGSVRVGAAQNTYATYADTLSRSRRR